MPLRTLDENVNDGDLVIVYFNTGGCSVGFYDLSSSDAGNATFCSQYNKGFFGNRSYLRKRSGVFSPGPDGRVVESYEILRRRQDN